VPACLVNWGGGEVSSGAVLARGCVRGRLRMSERGLCAVLCSSEHPWLSGKEASDTPLGNEVLKRIKNLLGRQQ